LGDPSGEVEISCAWGFLIDTAGDFSVGREGVSRDCSGPATRGNRHKRIRSMHWELTWALARAGRS
jgi:hypothetical protein